MAFSSGKKALSFFYLSKEFDPYIFKKQWLPVQTRLQNKKVNVAKRNRDHVNIAHTSTLTDMWEMYM